jgi:hypothetical protein
MNVSLCIAVVTDAEVAEVLFEKRFIEMVFAGEISLDFGRRGFAFAVEGAAGREMNQSEAEKADDQEQRYHQQYAFDKIHAQLALAEAVVFAVLST